TRRAAGLRSRLAGFFLQPLASDANALLLVRVRWPQRAHVRGNLSNLALVRAAHDDVRLLFHRNLNAFRNREFDWMGLAKREGNLFALQLSAMAHAHDVKLLLQARGPTM